MLAELLLALSQVVPSEDIVVSGRSSEDAARRYVENVAPVVPFDAPFARFYDPVCVGVAGLPTEANRVVADRVGEIARSVKLRVGDQGCTPNLLVLFVPDGKAAVGKLKHANAQGANSQTLTDLRRIAAEPGAARAWIEVETRSRDGDRPRYTPGSAPDLRLSTSSRLSALTRRDILSATVLIDRDAMADRDLRQAADYAAMRALSGARLREAAGQNSILSAFTPDGDDAAPTALTANDRGFLDGLYSGNGNAFSMMKKQAIVRSMVREKDIAP
ncbi:hypothetical protein [Sphingomonas sp. OTU376]|uniref:hypothetical protein n=1 Tax=Sphingomonas sp. OTU376 TaxID=3043863 RepID=UPI00313DC89F